MIVEIQMSFLRWEISEEGIEYMFEKSAHFLPLKLALFGFELGLFWLCFSLTAEFAKNTEK